ncbi:MAG: PEGA domain-containing protein, partial [Candidatus Riflebacteria bacterium]|nr:PEGA domain-containing protein [Candidatus Riflebacteria bacterium]
PAASPAAALAAMAIEAIPGGRIYLDGKYRGLNRVKIADLPPGSHEVTILEEGHRTHVEVVNVGAGDERTFKIQLQKR